jgi:hypothetical protein
MRRPQWLAILPIGDKRLVDDLIRERDAAVVGGPVAALRTANGWENWKSADPSLVRSRQGR